MFFTSAYASGRLQPVGATGGLPLHRIAKMTSAHACSLPFNEFGDDPQQNSMVGLGALFFPSASQAARSPVQDIYGDFKGPTVVREDYTGGMDLHDLHPFDDRPLAEDHAVNHGAAL